MIICSECETAQMLQITESHISFRNGQRIVELDESYLCTLCGSEGSYSYTDDGVTGHIVIEGEIEETDEKPVSTV